MGKEPWEGSGRPPWESGGDLPWDTPGEAEWEPQNPEAWRGDVHLMDWPENLAGAEYNLYKKSSGHEWWSKKSLKKDEIDEKK